MSSRNSSISRAGVFIVPIILIAATFVMWPAAAPTLNQLLDSSKLAVRKATGEAQLVSAEAMPGPDAPMCEWQPAGSLPGRAMIVPVAQTAEQEKNAKDVNRRYVPGEDERPP